MIILRSFLKKENNKSLIHLYAINLFKWKNRNKFIYLFIFYNIHYINQFYSKREICVRLHVNINSNCPIKQNHFSYFFISLRESSSFKSNALFCNAPISLPNFLKLDFSLRRLRYSLWNMHVMKLFIMAKKADKVAIFQYQMFASSLTANTVIPINRNTPVK